MENICSVINRGNLVNHKQNDQAEMKIQQNLYVCMLSMSIHSFFSPGEFAGKLYVCSIDSYWNLCIM